MQLDKLVAFHKMMGDPTRVRIISLLANKPWNGQALAEKLGLSAPTITHHLKKMREINVVYERRDKNTIYFFLNKSVILQQTDSLRNLAIGMEESVMAVTNEEQAKIVENFFTKEGRLKNIPSQRKKKLVVFKYMLKGIEFGRKYEEKEINEYIKQYFDDYATIRREFIINHFMYRENNIYELNPEEMWAK
ncbi:metalloregulator ArsR/SmtB family transcription factor [Cytobacillus oceanisediminis]|uniref:Metalloregulator ArsR/SmtB family transcription factor n=2 Tax=Niallia TaxID=2837506 RepID=A0A941GK28_NIACI|nr:MULTISPECIES: metalloregulator ArsR/SmtB family transcription factor [Bacillaceae]EOR26966.1 transcriptional regulator [Niallia nealsonii AAU1]MBQ6446493.1 metalloregulator ArsR/SmtB family transcription factor [Bacillus sp. (in: firmicutes)]MDU1845350.1 metalloregulator ArsR/SmtB family transcription factor [Niallia nealsonii]MBZ9535901.1 metalloregulator ArsR/SmtB family transcription factor [Cytobacillus oceanisediminis]MCB5237588.1 metalloregulator ArsR/SmtB family transcription factor 